MKYLLPIILSLLLVTPALAQVTASTANTILKQGETSYLRIPCFNSTNRYCDSSVKCNITVYYPNSTVLVNNAKMTNQLSYNNYTINGNLIKDAGIYDGVITCVSPSQGNGFSNTKIIVNRDGIDLSGNMTSITLIGIILISLLIFFIIMAIIMESNLKLVFTGLSFIMLPIILFVSQIVVENALIPLPIINMVSTGYILSLYLLGAFVMYALYKLTMGLKIKNNANSGAPTTQTLDKGTGNNYGSEFGSGVKKKIVKEEQKQDYEDNGEFDE